MATTPPLLASHGGEHQKLRPSERTLFWLNTSAAALHAVQGIVILALNKDWTVPILREYSVWTPEDPTYGCFETLPDGQVNRCYQSSATKEIGRASTKWEIAVFFFLSAAFQGTVSSLWGRRDESGRVARRRANRRGDQLGYYARFIAAGINPLRWVEYAISASLMALVIAQLTGFYSLNDQLLIFGAMAGTMLCGLLHEVLQVVLLAYESQAQLAAEVPGGPSRGLFVEKSYIRMIRYLAHVAGWIPYMGVWTAIGVRFFDTLGSSDLKPPWQVYVIIIGLFFGFSGFAFTQIYITRKAAGQDVSHDARLRAYHRGEAMYITLSLVTKTILCWNLYGGVIVRDGKLFN